MTLTTEERECAASEAADFATDAEQVAAAVEALDAIEDDRIDEWRRGRLRLAGMTRTGLVFDQGKPYVSGAALQAG